MKKEYKIMLISFLLICGINSMTFKEIMDKIQLTGRLGTMAVAGGDNLTMLKACRTAKDRTVVNSILVGDEEKIRNIARENYIPIEDFKIINVKDPLEIAKTAIKLVREGKADLYAKGSIQTRYFLKAILDKDEGLRTKNLISAVAIMEMPDINRLLLMTDPSINMKPTLTDKINIINNAVQVANGVGIENPKIAVLSAIEIVNKRMPQTIDAAKLKELNEKGEIKNCIIEGPLSMDLAVDPEACKLKNIKNKKINGDADIVVFPDIHSANIAYKISVRLGKTKSGTLLAGTSVPVVYSSRSDSYENKLNSILLASAYAQYLEEKSHPYLDHQYYKIIKKKRNETKDF